MAGKRKSPVIRMNAGESGREAIERFLLFKRADGVKIKSLESYSQHFKAISYHLDLDKNITEWTKNDLAAMIESMQAHELSPNSIKSYTIALKAFLSWCNKEGLTTLNIAIYKGEDTIKETYTDDELCRRRYRCGEALRNKSQRCVTGKSVWTCTREWMRKRCRFL